jgi:4-alpha-glucanotransferase
MNHSPSPTHEELLRRAADLWGMAPGYHDIWGQWHDATPPAQKAVLRSLGVPADSEAGLRQAIEHRLRREWEHMLPEVLVVSPHNPQFPLHLAGEPPEALHLQLTGEQGDEHERTVPLAGAPVLAEIEIGGRLFRRYAVSWTGNLPVGYHRCRASLGDGRACESRIIVGTDHAWLPDSLDQGQRRAGLAVSLYGVHSHHTWGCGDFTALRGLIDWVAEFLHGSYIALNPLHSIHNRQPYNTSPYLPNSVFYRNFIYLDIQAIPEMTRSRAASQLLERSETVREIGESNRSEFVEYERVAALKLRFLKILFRCFLATEIRSRTPRAQNFAAYAEREGDLLDRFALYSALDEWLHRRNPDLWVWPDWPEPFRDPNSDACREFARNHPNAVLFYKYVQWQIDEQLALTQDYARRKGLEIGLFHDMPLATDRCGSDLWAHRDFYTQGCRVGAPPDDFSPQGQDWSFPPPNADRHRQDGYQLFAETIRKSARHGGALRIDHVMRLFRLYWIPEGCDATQGVYMRDHAEDLLRVLALESRRGRFLVVGEDLGTVEPEVREMLARFGILSYRLFYFEKHRDGSFQRPEEYPAQALVSSTTHDLATLAGFWTGRDIEARRQCGTSDEASYRQQWEERNRDKQRMIDVLFETGLLPPDYPRRVAEIPELTGEVHNAITGFLVSTPAMLMTLNQEDLTKETEQQNLPGTTAEYPNWRRKMRFSVEELWEQTALDFAGMFRHWVDRSGRRPPQTEPKPTN